MRSGLLPRGPCVQQGRSPARREGTGSREGGSEPQEAQVPGLSRPAAHAGGGGASTEKAGRPQTRDFLKQEPSEQKDRASAGDKYQQRIAWQEDNIMELWSSTPMDSLAPKTYSFNFRNLLLAPGRNNTYICFEVEKRKYNSPKSYYCGVFRNQPSHVQHVYLEEPLHAEQRFLSWFDDTILSRRAEYQVTWYMSWSPCSECAQEVVAFLEAHENVSLSIFASRLYKCEDEEQQQGLRLLDQAGVQVAMMCPEDFEYCWDNFVDHPGWPFRYWKDICRNYCALYETLEEILW